MNVIATSFFLSMIQWITTISNSSFSRQYYEYFNLNRTINLYFTISHSIHFILYNSILHYVMKCLISCTVIIFWDNVCILVQHLYILYIYILIGINTIKINILKSMQHKLLIYIIHTYLPCAAVRIRLPSHDWPTLYFK